MNYKVEKVFDAYGYKCVVVFQKMGHRCGYVGIPKEHPLYGKTSTERLPFKLSDYPDAPVINYVAMFSMMNEDNFDIQNWFKVHGGITYSKGSENYPITSDDLWWFGFDCAHAGDAPDYALAQEYFGETPFRFELEGDVVRDLDYVVKETKSLAKQLYETGKSMSR